MTRTIGQRELRNDNATIMDALVGGEDFVVTRNGIPVAELRPIRQGRATFVSRAAITDITSVGPHIDAVQFRTDTDEIVDQGWNADWTS